MNPHRNSAKAVLCWLGFVAGLKPGAFQVGRAREYENPVGHWSHLRHGDHVVEHVFNLHAARAGVEPQGFNESRVKS